MRQQTPVDTAGDGDPPVSLRPALPWLALTLGVGVAAVVVCLARFAELPDPYPVHFGLAGDPDRFDDRSHANVLMPVVVGQLSALSVFACLLLVRGQGHRRLVAPLAALACVIGGGISLVSIAQYLSADAVAPPWSFWALLAGIVVTTVWVVVAAVRVGRASQDDHEGWRLGGLVYVDPDDPEVFVSKRVGVGVTLNLGRPLGWVVLALVLLPVALVVVLVSVSA